ncbi:MAG: thioredoxin family protein, partial [Bdellovibrionales bacterium]
QFQQPGFLMFLVLLLTFFAANLWGLFDISLPRFLADRMDSPYHPKLAGDFATGAFATLLATPCSAPFLGTAVGFAMVSGIREIFAIFAALGLGMALPYLTVALFPCAATCLPKPGAWMIVLRRFLGFALALTAAWLIWVMAAQITPTNASAFALLMVALTILLALRKQGASKKLATIGVLVVCSAAIILGIGGKIQSEGTSRTEPLWLQYNPATLRADIAEGKTVFLDVTADWCLTCVANKKFALSNEAVVQRLFHSDVIAMQANWTNPDPAISDLLHKYGRYGIPFNAVFGPGAPQGIVLPELLSPSLVLKALDDAAVKK